MSGFVGLVRSATRPLALVAALLTTTCEDSPLGPGAESDLPGDALIVFAEQDPVALDWRLYTVGADGSELGELLFPRENPGSDPDVIVHKPSWSPDGSRIAYRASATGTDDRYIVMIDAAGSAKRILTPMGGFADFHYWSPRGDRLLIATGSPFLGGLIQSVLVDTTGVSTEFSIADEGALFQGRRVYFNLSPVDGSTVYDAQWAPGGEDLFVVGFLDEPQQAGVGVDQVEVFRVNVSTGRIVARVTNNLFDEAGFVASPDGRSFALARGEGPDRRVWFGRFDGTEFQTVLDAVPESEPRWAQDSRHLVFGSPPSGGVVIADTRTREVVRVIGPQFATHPDVYCGTC